MVFYRLYFLLFWSLSTANLYATVDLDWQYESSGPTHWPERFEICNSGTKQSPIDIRSDIVSRAEPRLGYPDKLVFEPGPKKVRALNNGHTIKIEYLEEYIFKYGSKEYKLKQMHFHHLSETTIEGTHYPLEAHFVHRAEDGSLLVIGVLIDHEESSTKLLSLFQNVAKEEKYKAISWLFDAKDILPENMDYYSFDGSLTTPPCTEKVQWLVLKERGKVSQEDTDFFEDHFFYANYREIQDLNDRKVLNFQ